MEKSPNEGVADIDGFPFESNTTYVPQILKIVPSNLNSVFGNVYVQISGTTGALIWGENNAGSFLFNHTNINND